MKVRSAEKWSESAKKWCESAHNGEPSFSQQECLRQLRLALEKNLGRAHLWNHNCCVAPRCRSALGRSDRVIATLLFRISLFRPSSSRHSSLIWCSGRAHLWNHNCCVAPRCRSALGRSDRVIATLLFRISLFRPSSSRHSSLIWCSIIPDEEEAEIFHSSTIEYL